MTNLIKTDINNITESERALELGLIELEQRVAERTEALKKSEMLLLEMTTQVPGVVYQFYARPNGEMGFYYISDRSEWVLGLKPDLEGYFERFTALVVPEHREGFIKSIEKSVKESSEWKYEGMLQKPSGEKIWFFGNCIPLPRENEMVFNGIVTDITERKKSEEVLRKSEARYRLLAENTTDTIWIADMDMNLIFISPTIGRLLGYSVEEAMNTTMKKVYAPASFELAMKALEDELINDKDRDSHRSRIMEFELVRKDGSTIFAEGNFTFLRDENGQPSRILTIIINITER